MRFLGTSFIKTEEKYLYDNIPHSFNGLKVLQISDLMYGSTINDSDLEKISNEVKMINPDIIFFTGDLVGNNYNLIKKDNIESFLTNLSAPYGKYAITMNGHITALIDGIIYDTFDPSNRIMRCAWKID